MLSPSERQVAYALLTRLPLGPLIQQADQKNPVRLACVKHAASVRPEPGSNSPINLLKNLDWLSSVKRIADCYVLSQSMSFEKFPSLTSGLHVTNVTCLFCIV